jgi:hypothetical protein
MTPADPSSPELKQEGGALNQFPAHIDRKHFEVLVLSGAHAGLNWSLVLKNREGYRSAPGITGAPVRGAALPIAALPIRA